MCLTNNVDAFQFALLVGHRVVPLPLLEHLHNQLEKNVDN